MGKRWLKRPYKIRTQARIMDDWEQAHKELKSDINQMKEPLAAIMPTLQNREKKAERISSARNGGQSGTLSNLPRFTFMIIQVLSSNSLEINTPPLPPYGLSLATHH